jgi:hypothetical protein
MSPQRLIPFAMAMGVTLFAVVVVFLADGGPSGYAASLSAPVGAPSLGWLALAVLSIPVASRLGSHFAGRLGDASSDQEIATAVIVPMAILEGVALIGVVMAFVGLGHAGLALAAVALIWWGAYRFQPGEPARHGGRG